MPYPDDIQATRYGVESQFYCKDCDMLFDVIGSVDLGQWEADREEDGCCPECGQYVEFND